MNKEMTATLRPVKAGQKIHFTGKVVLPNGDPVWITQSSKNNPSMAYQAPALRQNDQMLYVKFDEEQTFLKLKWNVDDLGNGVSHFDKEMKQVVSWLGKHTQVSVLYGERNENQRGDHLFTLSFESEKVNKEAEALFKKYDVFSKLVSMTGEEKAKIAFRYGINALNMTNLDLLVRLGDFNSGILMSDIIPDGEQKAYIDHFLESYAPDNHIDDLKIVVNQGIACEVFTKNANGFFLEKEHIGLRTENIIAYLDKNPDILKYVRGEIARKSTPIVDDTEIGTPKNVNVPEMQKNAVKLTSMQEMAKKLRVRGWAVTKNMDLLAKALVDAQHIKAEMEMYGLRWSRKWQWIDECEGTLRLTRRERADSGMEIYNPELNKDIITEW